MEGMETTEAYNSLPLYFDSGRDQPHLLGPRTGHGLDLFPRLRHPTMSAGDPSRKHVGRGRVPAHRELTMKLTLTWGKGLGARWSARSEILAEDQVKPTTKAPPTS